ncbi:MAG TPA: pitrilysin family protein [Candidatus Acidoferrales bacterium]|nr:pitrilysin family protein [Candidatus Acidoferrales bacterium]
MTSREKLHLPEYRKITLPNGMTLLLMEQHKLPLVSFEAILRCGSTADAPGAEGTASVTASLLRHGTKTHTADRYSDVLDFIGGIFHAGASADYTSISAEFMKKDLATGLDLLAEPLLEPVFPEEEITKVLRQRMDGIRAAKDKAQHVIAAYFNAYLFQGHPYGRAVGGDEESLTHIQRDSIAGFYRDQYDPANVILAAVGDFESSEMERLLGEKFGAWPAHKTAPAVNVDLAPSQKRRLLLVDKPDSTQTYFRIGNVGIARTDPDYVPLMLVNTLFGGRFTSLINSALRIESGLTYGAASTFDVRRSAGPFYIASYTPNATTSRALDVAVEVLKQFHRNGISEQQLASAKSYLKGQFPLRMETSDQLASLIAHLESYRLERSEIDELYGRIDATSVDDAIRAIERHYPEDDLVFVLIGKAGEIGEVASRYAARMNVCSISDPGFAPRTVVDAAPATGPKLR